MESQLHRYLVSYFNAQNNNAESVAREVLGNQSENLRKAGRSWGCVSAIDSDGRIIWIAEPHRDGKRFIVHADDKLTAFLTLKLQLVATKD